jgi:hypothetical protein
MKRLLIFHSNNGRTKAPQYYVIRTLPVLLIPIIWTLYIYVSKCVRIRGYFFKPKGVNAQKKFGKHCSPWIYWCGGDRNWMRDAASEQRLVNLPWRIWISFLAQSACPKMPRSSSNYKCWYITWKKRSQWKPHSVFKTRQLWFRFLSRHRNRRLEIRLGDRTSNTVVGNRLWTLEATVAKGYVLRGGDQRARASMRVQAIGVFVSYVTATG